MRFFVVLLNTKLETLSLRIETNEPCSNKISLYFNCFFTLYKLNDSKSISNSKLCKNSSIVFKTTYESSTEDELVESVLQVRKFKNLSF